MSISIRTCKSGDLPHQWKEPPCSGQQISRDLWSKTFQILQQKGQALHKSKFRQRRSPLLQRLQFKAKSKCQQSPLKKATLMLAFVQSSGPFQTRTGFMGCEDTVEGLIPEGRLWLKCMSHVQKESQNKEEPQAQTEPITGHSCEYGTSYLEWSSKCHSFWGSEISKQKQADQRRRQISLENNGI